MNKILLVLLLVSAPVMAENVYDTACRDDFKFTPETEAFSNCVLQLTIEGKRAFQAEMEQNRAIQQSELAARREMAMRMYRPIQMPQIQPYQMPIRPSIRCQWIGNIWSCN